MKRVLSLFLFVLIIFSSFVCFAKESVNVFVNGEIIDAKGKIINDHSLIPMRAFLEKTGFTVSWIDEEKRVVAKKEGFNIDLKIGRSTMLVNEEEITLACPAEIIDGVTYVPVRAIGENTGFDVTWYDASKSAVLSDGSDKYTYYDGANSLLPVLSSVFSSEASEAPQEEIKTANTGYTYDNIPESKAHEYGDILCSDFGYEYDSLELGADYSKHYLYTVGDVCTDIEVKTVDSVPYVTVYPDINPDNYHINVEEIVIDEEKHNPKGVLEYYEGTSIPKFTYITGIVVSTLDRTEEGDVVYIYSGSVIDVANYVSFLLDCGFSYTDETGAASDGRYNYVLARNKEYILINAAMLSNRIYIVPYK